MTRHERTGWTVALLWQIIALLGAIRLGDVPLLVVAAVAVTLSAHIVLGARR